MNSNLGILTSMVGNSRRRGRGFTLLELMIVLTIIGILAAIAYPSYVDYVVKSNRAVAKSSLVQLVARQEAYFILHKKYADNIMDLGYPSSPTGLRSNGGLVNLSKGSSDDIIYKLQVGTEFSSDYNFRIEAVPVNMQTRDDQCGTLYITANGSRGTSTNNADRCW